MKHTNIRARALSLSLSLSRSLSRSLSLALSLSLSLLVAARRAQRNMDAHIHASRVVATTCTACCSPERGGRPQREGERERPSRWLLAV
jgi:hypothetical protein